MTYHLEMASSLWIGFCLLFLSLPVDTENTYYEYLPVMYVDKPYVNEWSTKVFVDEGAEVEDFYLANAWNYFDPEPTIMRLNPEFLYEAPNDWVVDYVNYYTIEDKSYHWWSTSVGEDEVCFETTCYAQGENWFSIKSELDIDVIWVKVHEKEVCGTCFPSKPPLEIKEK